MAGEVSVDLHGHPGDGVPRRGSPGGSGPVDSGGGGQQEGRGVQGMRIQEVPCREGRADEVR